MAENPLPGGSGESGPVPVVDGVEDPFGFLSGAGDDTEQAPDEPQAPEPAELPAEDEADETDAPSAVEAPSEEEAEQPSADVADDATKARWIDLTVKSVNTGRPQFSQIPAGQREEVARRVDEAAGNTLATDALLAWQGKLSFTPEDVEEAKRQARQEAEQYSQEAYQQQAADQGIWEYFAQRDPAFNQELAGERFDLIDAAEEYPEAYERYRALRQQAAIQSDPQAQVQEVVRQQVGLGQRTLAQSIIGSFLSRSDIASAPGVRDKMALFEANPELGIVKAFGKDESLDGFVATLHAVFDAALEARSSEKAAKKVQEQKGAISEAAARQAQAKWREGVPRGDGLPGAGAGGYSREKLSDPEFWADMSTKSPDERAKAEQAYQRMGLGTPLRRQ